MNTQPERQPKDDGLEWLRDIRREMSAECNHDPHLFVEKMRALQKQYSNRLVRVRKVLEPVTAE